MPGSWQISGARHPTNSAKVREVLQEPVKICVLSHGLHRTVNIRFKKNEGQRKGSERERGGKQKKDRTQTDREPGQQKIKDK